MYRPIANGTGGLQKAVEGDLVPEELRPRLDRFGEVDNPVDTPGDTIST